MNLVCCVLKALPLEYLIKSIRIKRRKTVAIFQEVSRNSDFIALIFVGNIGCFNKLKTIGLNQRSLIKH